MKIVSFPDRFFPFCLWWPSQIKRKIAVWERDYHEDWLKVEIEIEHKLKQKLKPESDS